MEKPPRVGDRVVVPFGIRDVEGEVFRVEGKARTWVTVELFLDGGEEPTLMTYLLREVRPAEAA
ncbi:MAG: hypothetical protein AUI14_11830 [Actinobacteria bacterium 13_2_20CM_2_71_6]|nr:MAG: hypothetical protein AUI14_11830 [Actinobacteria bacterium 13_2_20CM_2_71_6]